MLRYYVGGEWGREGEREVREERRKRPQTRKGDSSRGYEKAGGRVAFYLCGYIALPQDINLPRTFSSCHLGLEGRRVAADKT